MASLNEIVYNIKNLTYAGSNNTEQDLSNRQIKFWIHYHRAQILRDLSRDGKGTPHPFLQNFNMGWHLDVGIGKEGPDGPNQSAFNEDWQAYLDLNLATPAQSIVMSDRSLELAGLTDNSIYDLDDFYGRDFYDMYTHEERADMGRLRFIIPSLLNINGHGISNLRIRKSDDGIGHDTNMKDIAILSEDEFKNKKYNRFSPKAVCATISSISDGTYRLTISNLKSHYRNMTNQYGAPILYTVYAHVLLSDPTDFPGWHDDMTYPIPDELISDLIKRITSMELSMIIGSRADEITDNADTTKIVQPQAQGQVRQR